METQGTFLQILHGDHFLLRWHMAGPRVREGLEVMLEFRVPFASIVLVEAQENGLQIEPVSLIRRT